MKVLKLTVAVAALTLSSVICHAQEQGDKNKKHDRIAQKLNLNPEQKEKLKVRSKSDNKYSRLSFMVLCVFDLLISTPHTILKNAIL